MTRNEVARISVVLALVSMAGAPSPASSQPPATPAPAPAPVRQPTPNDTLISPEVLSDGRAVFRIYAPKASEVSLRGDWMEAPGPVALQKDPQGVWSVTVGPLTPDFYSYTLTVDGVRTLDPKNATIKQGISSVDNMVMVPGPAAAFQDNKPVPHGEIRQAWYRSTTLEQPRRVHVYVPPGYDASPTMRFPVFYLLHGGGDEDSGWSTIGRAGFILDNLIAEKKAVPMIVVMPNGSLPRPANLPAPVPGTPPNPAAAAAMQDRFVSELMKDVIPLIEKQYRVLPGRDNRAIAGLSMGGGQTLRTIVSQPDQFAYAAIWSAGVNPQTTADFEQRAASFLGGADAVNSGYRVLNINVGDKDFALAGSKNLSEVLTKRGIKHQLIVTGGGHTWINWRQYLRDYAPLLFKKTTS
jgi:enterochelin esterase-like enzyme